MPEWRNFSFYASEGLIDENDFQKLENINSGLAHDN
jgi:hypothetical protein